MATDWKAIAKGWGGQDPVDHEILTAARRFVESLPDHLPGPMAVPTRNAGIQLEWHWPDQRRYLEIEFVTPLDIHWLRWEPPEQDERDGKIADALKLVEWFAGRCTNLMVGR